MGETVPVETDMERAKLNSLLMQAPAAICFLEGRRYIYSLPTDHHVRMHQLEGRQLIGRSVFEARPEVQGQGFEELLDRVYKTGVPYSGKELPLAVGTGDRRRDLFIDFVYQPKRNLQGEIDGILV